MKIYNYHPDTGELVGESVADESPLELDQYLIPAFATHIEPPQSQINKIPCFINGAWELLDDYRNKELYNCQTKELVLLELGQIPSENLTDIKPLESPCVFIEGDWVLDKATLQDMKWSEIKQQRALECQKPLTYLNKVFDFDKNSQDLLNGAVQAAQSAMLAQQTIPDITWTLADNSSFTMTLQQFIALPFAGVARTNSIFEYARQLREEIYKSTATIESVQAVEWNYGQ